METPVTKTTTTTTTRIRITTRGRPPRRIMGQSGWEVEQAIKEDNLKGIKAWMWRGTFDPNTVFRGRSLLTTCVHENRREILECLLEFGADPNGRSDEGGRRETPLITAVRLKKKNPSLVKLLISYGAHISARNFYGQDAIYQAVVDNAFEILEYLLSAWSSSPCTCLELGVTHEETGHHHHHLHPHHPHPQDDESTEQERVSMQCPVYLALTQSFVYPSKKTSLLQLLRFNYDCPCLALLFSEPSQIQLVSPTVALVAVPGHRHRGEGGSGSAGNRARTRMERGRRTLQLLSLSNSSQDRNATQNSTNNNYGNGSNILSSQEVIKVDSEIIHWIYLSHGLPVTKLGCGSDGPCLVSPSPSVSTGQTQGWQVNDGTTTKANREGRCEEDDEEREVLSLSSDLHVASISTSTSKSRASFLSPAAVSSASSGGNREVIYPTKLIYLSRIAIRKLSTIAARRGQTSFLNIIQALPLPPPLINFLMLGEIRG